MATDTEKTGFPLSSVIILFLAGLACLTRLAEEPGTVGRIAPYIGYTCIFLAVVSTLGYLMGKKKKNK